MKKKKFCDKLMRFSKEYLNWKWKQIFRLVRINKLSFSIKQKCKCLKLILWLWNYHSQFKTRLRKLLKNIITQTLSNCFKQFVNRWHLITQIKTKLQVYYLKTGLELDKELKFLKTLKTKWKILDLSWLIDDKCGTITTTNTRIGSK